jgi:uncharacterized protein GlcG (DUF336 family)
VAGRFHQAKRRLKMKARTLQYLAVSLGLAALAPSASAQEQRPGYGPSLTTTTAKKIAAGTIAECQKNNWNIAVAVVDTAGGLVYFERMEDTQTASLDIAIMKAKAAATYRRTTRAFADVISKGGPAIMTLPGVVASPGGVPVFVGGKVTGAVGVSGVTGDQDEQCAKAGISGGM